MKVETFYPLREGDPIAEMSEIAMGNDQSQSEMKFIEEHAQIPEDGEIFDEQDEEKPDDSLDTSCFDSKSDEGLAVEKPKEEPRGPPPHGWYVWNFHISTYTERG